MCSGCGVVAEFQKSPVGGGNGLKNGLHDHLCCGTARKKEQGFRVIVGVAPGGFREIPS
jgi:hypothetical protein